MKIKLFALLVLLPTISGCSLMTLGPGAPDWDRVLPTVQSRVRYVAMFAFTMDQIKPYKGEVCETTRMISEFLDTYDDQEATLEKLRAAITEYINTLDPNVREPVQIVVDMVLTEAFNYAWQYYEELLSQDQTRVALMIADAVAKGLAEACEMTVSIMEASLEAQPEPIPNDIFTVSRE